MMRSTGFARIVRIALVAVLASCALFGFSTASASADVVVTLSANQTSPYVNDNVTYTASVSSGACPIDPHPTYTYAFSTDGGATFSPTSSSPVFTHYFTSAGAASVQVHADIAGFGANCTPGGIASLPVNVVPLIATSMTATPSGDVTQGDTVTFSESATGGAAPLTYEWGSSCFPPNFPDHGTAIARRFLSSGQQATCVRITDSAQPAHQAYDQVSTHVNDAGRLYSSTVSQSPSGAVATNTPVTFTGPNQSDINGGVPPYTYAWSFDCASPYYTDGTGPTLIRTFAKPGTYCTSSHVTDSAIPSHSFITHNLTTVTKPEFATATCAPGELTDVKFALTHATGCFTKAEDGSYRTTKTFRLNGVPLAPGGSQVILAPPGKAGAGPGGQIGVGSVQIALGTITSPVYVGALNVQLPAAPSDPTKPQEGTVASLTASPFSLYGFKVGGTFTLALGKDAGGNYFSSFTLTLSLPAIFKNATGDGGITGTGSIKVNDDGSVNYNGMRIQASGAKIGALEVKNVCFSLIPSGSGAVTSCEIPSLPESASRDKAYVSCAANSATGDHWDATAELVLPFPSGEGKGAHVAVFGGGAGTTLTDLGGFGTNLNIPIAEGAKITTLGAGVCFTSPLTIRGDVGVAFLDQVKVVGTVVFTDSDPKKAKPWSMALQGAVNVFDEPIGHGGVTVFSNGNFDFNTNLDLTLAKVLNLSGAVAGWVEPSAKLFNIEGSVSVCVGESPLRACAGANGVVSSTGVAGCINIAGVSAGAGYRWSDKSLNLMSSSCSIGGYKATAAVAAAANGSRTLTVAPGTRGIALRVTGTTAPPKLRITGPGGTAISSPVAALARGSNYLLLEDAKHESTNVLLAHPEAGTYTITSLDKSNPITGLQTAPVLAPFSGHATVKPVGSGRQALKLSYVLPQGATLSLVDRGRHAERTIVKSVHGSACAGSGRKIAGGSALCFATRFVPASGEGGRRQIVAVVQQGGLPVSQTTVASYLAPMRRLPSKPATLQLRRRGSTVTIAWTPSSDAVQYALSARTSDGRSLSFFVKSSCRAVTITQVARGVGVVAKVQGVREDRMTGPLKTTRLNARKTLGGAGTKLLAGKACS
jgi:hypothetical protein